MSPVKPIGLAILAMLVLAPAIFARQAANPAFPSPVMPRSLRVNIREEGTELPISEARVQVRGMRGTTVSDTTNGAGECFFTSLPTDQYQIFVVADGYASNSSNTDLLDDTTLVLRLRKTAIGETPGGLTVSVRTLQLPAKALEAYQHGLRELYTNHKPEKSLPYFRATLAQAPDFYEAHRQMGVAYDEMGNSKEAEQEFRDAIRLSDGQDGPAQFFLAGMLSGRKEFADAEAACRKGLETSPQSGLGHYELARALLGQGKSDAAEQEANAALEDAHKPPRAYLILAAIHDQRHELGKLSYDLTEYLKLVPQGPTSDRMRRRLEEVRKEMQKQNSPGGNPPVSPAIP